MAQEHGRGVLATGKVNYFEWCRALGALAVLLLHTFIEMTNHVLPQLLVAGADAGAITCRIASYELIETLLTRWAVPVFLMISGALLLSPKKKMRPHYVWHYASRMIFVLAVFGTCFAAIKLHVEGVPLGIALVAQALVLTLTARRAGEGIGDLLELVHRHDLHRAGRDDLELFVYRQHMFSFSRREPKGRIAAFQSNS